MITVAMSAMGSDLFRRYMKGKYISALFRAGARVREVSLGEDLKAVAAQCDGLLLPGGADIEPGLYGREREAACGKPHPIRDALEPELLRAFLEADKPVLAICRGAQVLNVALGGTLHQDIKGLQKANHADFFRRASSSHTVILTPGSALEGILGSGTHRVNSMHHQAVEQVAPGLAVAAVSGDGFTEALEKPDCRFCIGVQWHPEHMAAKDPVQQGLFDAFVNACRS